MTPKTAFSTHDFTHDGVGKAKGTTSAIVASCLELPLLGSNQDSSDPESEGWAANCRQSPTTERDSKGTKLSGGIDFNSGGAPSDRATAAVLSRQRHRPKPTRNCARNWDKGIFGRGHLFSCLHPLGSCRTNDPTAPTFLMPPDATCDGCRTATGHPGPGLAGSTVEAARKGRTSVFGNEPLRPTFASRGGVSSQEAAHCPPPSGSSPRGKVRE